MLAEQIGFGERGREMVPPRSTSNRPNALIVDPIFRGSRLMYSAHAAEACRRAGLHPVVLARQGTPPAQHAEYFRGRPHDLLPVIPLPPEAWYVKLSAEQLRATMNLVASHAGRLSASVVFFSGWNEFFPRVALRPPSALRGASGAPTWFVDYNPAFWLSEPGRTFRQRLAAAAKRLAVRHAFLRMPRLRMFLLDERLRQEGGSLLPGSIAGRCAWLPEVAPRLESIPPIVRREAAVLLLVGNQSRRKGLEDIASALAAPTFPAAFKVRLVGRLDAELEHLRPILKAMPADRFEWEESYLSDAEIRRRYAEADYVGVPYGRAFDATSSVLAWAAAFGKPVVGTDHGVVGHRIRRHGLGSTYSSGDGAGLLAALKNLPRPGTDAYAEMRVRCLAYAADCSEETFLNRMAGALSG